jgi:hypothetical protein
MPDRKGSRALSSIVTVPANLTSDVRNGLHNVLSEAATEVAAVADHRDRDTHPEWYARPVARFKRTCALLDLVGWSNPVPAAAAPIDVGAHHQALCDALDMALNLADGEIEQLETVDAARAARHESSIREITIKRVLALHEFASAVREAVSAL